MSTAEPVTAPTPDDRIAAALWFADHGFGIFSVWSTRDGRCRCPAGRACASPGKHPLTPNGFRDATTDPARIRTLLSAASQPNYGMLPPEGVFVWDVDTDGERARLAGLEARLGPLPPTLRDDTGNGQHVFLRWPEGLPRPVHRMFGLVTRWGSGAAQGYVVGPLSVHVSGRVYRSAAGSVADIATLPEAWARAAIEGEPGRLSFHAAAGDPAGVAVGGRHDWLRDTARLYAGTVRDPDALFAAVWVANERLAVPKTREEVARAIGDVLARFPADPVEEDPETGGPRRAPSDEGIGILEPRDDADLFPAPPAPVAFEGPIGEAALHLASGTDASEVGLLASLLALCGALMPAHGYYHGTHTSSPFLALVGVTGDGRKGTAMHRAKDALGLALGTQAVNRLTIGGTASGEGLIRALRDRGTAPTGMLFEEEYGRYLAAAGREGSTLDSLMRLAWDGATLANTKVSASDSMSVSMPYWLSALVGITPDELRRRMPDGATRSGSANRWLWLPVGRRDVMVRSTEPHLPGDLAERLVSAHRLAAVPRRVERADGVDEALSEYDRFLRAEAVGLAADMSRRYPATAFRVALVHAASEASDVVTTGHVMRALALTEYARRGLAWTFGDALGDGHATLLLRQLQEEGSLSHGTISKHLIRDAVRRQDAIDELCRLGLAHRVVIQTGGRKRTELRLTARKGDFRDFRALFGVPHPGDDRPAERGEARESAQKGAPERDTDRAIGAQKRAEVPVWARPCRDYAAHRDHHRNRPGGWVCLACDGEEAP